MPYQRNFSEILPTISRSYTVDMIEESLLLLDSSSVTLPQIPATITSKKVYGRAKKDPLEWVTEPNVVQSEIFKEEFNAKTKDICSNLQKAEDFFRLILPYFIGNKHR